jgi:hypothetical protein
MRTDEECDGGVISVLAEPGADRIPPLGHPDADEVTRVLTRPVFVEGGARRRRVLGRAGGALAVLCVAYLVMFGVSVTALPTAGRPVAGAGAAPSGPAAGSTPARARASAAQDQIRLPVRPRATPDSDGDEPAVPLRRAAAPPPTRSLPVPLTPPPPTPPPTARPTAPPRHDRDRPDTTKTRKVPATATTRTPA